jgi:hypothetical protein
VQIQADLVVGCDGRHSVVQKAANLQVLEFGVPIDVLWFRLSRQANDPQLGLVRCRGLVLRLAILLALFAFIVVDTRRSWKLSRTPFIKCPSGIPKPRPIGCHLRVFACRPSSRLEVPALQALKSLRAQPGQGSRAAFPFY